MKALLIVAALLVQGAPVRAQPGVVAGRLLAVDGTPAVGVRVVALGAEDKGATGAFMGIGVTNNLGRYRLDDVPPGRYIIMAGPLDRPIYFPGVPFETQARVVTVTDHALVEGIDFRMVIVPPLRVEGRVLHDNNPVLVGASAKIVLTGGGSSFNATIAPDGSFRFPDVRPGVYQVSIPGGAAIISGNVVTVTDHDVAGLELVAALTSVKLRVSDSSIRRLEVRRMETGSNLFQAEIKADGSFEFAALPGPYSVTAPSSSAIPLPDITITLPVSASVNLEIVLPRLSPVIVRASVEGGSALPPFVLRIEGTVVQGSSRQASSPGATLLATPALTIVGFTVDIRPGPDGTSRILLPEGRYRFGAGLPEGPPSPLRFKSIESAGANLLENTLTIAPTVSPEIHVLFTRAR